jgi:ribonuclease PH
MLPRVPLREGLAAISVGLVDGEPLLDLCYEEDSRADVDFNFVGTSGGRLAELQGTAEGATFTTEQLAAMTSLAMQGIAEIVRIQEEALADAGAAR